MNTISVQPITDRPIIDAIAPDDFMLIGDASDNNVVKRVLVSSLKSFFTASSPTPTPTPTPTGFALRINCGGNQYTDPSGNIWSGNIHQVQGGIFTRSNVDTINSPLAPLYLSEAYSFKYLIPLPNGVYAVALHFAEFDNPANWGERRFDVLLNDQGALVNYSIFADVGLSQTAIKSFSITVTTGFLAIDSVSLLNTSKICAIEILG